MLDANKDFEDRKLAISEEAIEKAINRDFDGMYLNPDCAKGVIDKYGFDRVNYVLANTLKEKSELIKNAGENIFVNILPLVDDFERAMKAMETTEDIEAVKEGINLIYSKFMSFLNTNGVKVIPTDNEPFDVDKHEAVTLYPAPTEDQKGKIIDCMSKGYMLNDKVIRYAKVVVGE